MNERPPNEEDDVDEQYRRASARDGSGPSESVRRAVLRHAAELAAQRGPREPAPAKIDFKQPAANEVRWRPAAYGGLAAAALAGLLIAPHFLPPSSPPPERRAPAAAPNPGLAPRSVLAPRSALAPRADVPVETPRAPNAADAASAANRSAHYKAAAPPALAAKPQAFAGETQLNESSPAILGGNSTPQAAAQAAPAPPPLLGPLAARPHAPIDAATALRQAAQSGDTSRLQALLEGQIDVDARDGDGRTALMLAVLRGQAQAVDALLARGADPNAADSSGTTPLQAAVAGNQSVIIAALRRAGAR